MNILEIVGRFKRSLRQYPVIIVPFLLMGFFDLVLLAVLYFASKPPVLNAMEPFIRTFWGEKYLHYPANLLLLPEIFGYGKNALMFVTGLIASGLTLAMILQISNNMEPNWKICASKTFKKYLSMFFIWALVMTIDAIIIKTLGNFDIVFNSSKNMFIAEFFAGITAQTIFVFSIPAIIIENKKIVLSIKRTLYLVKTYPFISLAIIILPSMLLVPLYYIHFKMTYLFGALFPEVVLLALILRIIITTVVDFVITSSAAFVLLTHKEFENKKIAA
jgi:hypothetical protein